MAGAGAGVGVDERGEGRRQKGDVGGVEPERPHHVPRHPQVVVDREQVGRADDVADRAVVCAVVRYADQKSSRDRLGHGEPPGLGRPCTLR